MQPPHYQSIQDEPLKERLSLQILELLTGTPSTHTHTHTQGLNPPKDSDQTEAAALALNWKRKLYHQLSMEAITAPLGARGLRKLNRNRISTPSLVDVIQPRPTSPTSYVPK